MWCLILRDHQPKGLYRGATSSFVGVSIESAVLFGAYTQIKASLQVLNTVQLIEYEKLSKYAYICCGHDVVR